MPVRRRRSLRVPTYSLMHVSTLIRGHNLVTLGFPCFEDIEDEAERYEAMRVAWPKLRRILGLLRGTARSS